MHSGDGLPSSCFGISIPTSWMSMARGRLQQARPQTTLRAKKSKATSFVVYLKKLNRIWWIPKKTEEPHRHWGKGGGISSSGLSQRRKWRENVTCPEWEAVALEVGDLATRPLPWHALHSLGFCPAGDNDGSVCFEKKWFERKKISTPKPAVKPWHRFLSRGVGANREQRTGGLNPYITRYSWYASYGYRGGEWHGPIWSELIYLYQAKKCIKMLKN